MSRVALLFVLAIFVPSVGAQVVVQLSGGMSASTGLVSGGTQQWLGPVSGSGFFGTFYGSLGTTVGPTTTLQLGVFKFSTAYYASAGANISLTYSANAPVAGLLRFTGTGGQNSASVLVDVEGDTLVELFATSGQGAVVVDVPVVLGPRAIAVVVDLSASTSTSVGSSADLTVQFLPQTNLATVGVVCGPSLEASLRKPTATTAGRLFLHVADSPVPTGDIAAILVGSTPLPMGATCGQGLLDDALVLVAPILGGINVPVPLSTGLVGSVYLQYVALTLPSQLSWSNRIGLTLP